MTAFATVGFPRMMKEQGEIRVFLPNFIQFVANFGKRVLLVIDSSRCARRSKITTHEASAIALCC